MILLPEILLICCLIFLYCLFVFAKDDFLLLRKNITLEQLFNVAIIGFLISLFTARVGYVLEHLHPRYLDPLVFIIFPYFPGLSPAGGILGGSLFLWISAKKKKIPLGRFADIVGISFLFAWAIGMLLFSLVEILVERKFFLYLPASIIVFLFAWFFTW